MKIFQAFLEQIKMDESSRRGAGHDHQRLVFGKKSSRSDSWFQPLASHSSSEWNTSSTLEPGS